jgi:ribose transport system permease protein
MTTASPTASETSKSTARNLWDRIKRSAPIYLVLILLLLWVGYMNPRFIEPKGFLQFLKRAAPLIIVTAGQVFVLITGGFDLSVGSLMTFVVVGSALLIDNDPSKVPMTIVFLFAAGIFVGLINGLVVSYLKVPSFIATLGMLLMIKGATLYWSGGAPRGYLTDNFRAFGRGNITNVPVVDRIPYAVLILIVVSIVAIWLLHRTNFGRQVFAVGDNSRTAMLSGIKVKRVRILAFILSSISAIIAGIVLGGFGGVTVIAGEGYELQAISAAVIGGTQLMGGRGSMAGALAGALVLQVLFTLLNLLGLPKPLRDAVQGTIIIAAVAYAAYRSYKNN